MSLDSYANLKAELVAWLRRSNITVDTGIIPTAITLFEAYARRELQAEDMLLETELVSEAGISDVQLPDDFRSVDTLRISDNPQMLTMLTRDSLSRMWGTVPGRPRNYALGPTDSNTGKRMLRLGPVPDSDYTLLLTYNAKLVALSTARTSNWLLVYAPDLYLYGSLYQLFNYTRDADSKALVAPDLTTIMQNIKEDQQRLKAAGPGQLQCQPTGMTP